MLEEECAVEYHSTRSQRMSKVHTRWVNLLGRGTADSRTRSGPFAYNPGRACSTRPLALEQQRPGEGKRQARGRLQQGKAPSPAGGPGRAVPRPWGWAAAGPASPPLLSPPCPTAAGRRAQPEGPLTSSASFPRGMPMARRPVWSSAMSTLPSSLRSSFRKRLAYRESPSLFPSQAAAGRRKPRRRWNMSGPCSAYTRTAFRSSRRLGEDETPPGMLPAPAAARGGERRGKERREGPGGPSRRPEAEGGRGAAGLAPPVPPSFPPPPPPGGKCARREEGGPQPRGLSTALVPAQRFQQRQRNSTKGAKDLVWILGLIPVPPRSSLAVKGSVEGVWRAPQPKGSLKELGYLAEQNKHYNRKRLGFFPP